MSRISIGAKKDPKGNTLWEVAQADGDVDGNGLHIECTYQRTITGIGIVDFYQNRFLVEQSELIDDLMFLYDTEETRRDIEDYEFTEASNETFSKEHLGEL